MTDERETVLHQFSNEEQKHLRFVQAACSNDQKRPQLTGIYMDSIVSVAADGFRLHTGMGISSLAQLYPNSLPGVFRPITSTGKTKRLPVNPEWVEIQQIEKEFPNWLNIMPSGEPTFRYAVNKNFLKDLALMPGGEMIMFEFWKPTTPCLVTNLTEDVRGRGNDFEFNQCKAVIMPMWLPDNLQKDPQRTITELRAENRKLRLMLGELAPEEEQDVSEQE